MTTVKEHYGIAELHSGVVTPGHYYCYRNEPSAHYNHVHVAYLPWGEPDAPSAHPPNNCPDTTEASKVFRDAVAAKFPGRYRWNGGCVYKHRNSSSTDSWSQHAFGNADDFMANYEDQDDLLNWLESPWEGEDDVNENEHNWLQFIYNRTKELDQEIGPGAEGQNHDWWRGWRAAYAGDDQPGDEWAAMGWQAGTDLIEAARAARAAREAD